MLLDRLFRESEVPSGIKARDISDFLIDEKAYKADFDLQARWDASVTELERLSLLGVAAYGFLITTISSDKLGSPTLLATLHRYRYLPISGVLCFAVAAALALICNVLSCKCMKWQVDILRGFARLGSERWTKEDQDKIRNRVRHFQNEQRLQMRWNKLLLRASTGLLCIGAVATAVTFALVLL